MARTRVYTCSVQRTQSRAPTCTSSTGPRADAISPLALIKHTAPPYTWREGGSGGTSVPFPFAGRSPVSDARRSARMQSSTVSVASIELAEGKAAASADTLWPESLAEFASYINAVSASGNFVVELILKP